MATEQQLYLRFGEWPQDERSYCPGLWSNCLFDAGSWLDGVCAFPTRYDASAGEYLYNDEQAEAHMQAFIQGCFGALALPLRVRRTVYIVTGQPTGRGPAGETLLRKLKIVGHAIVIASDLDLLARPRIVPVSKSLWRALQAIKGENTCLWLNIN